MKRPNISFSLFVPQVVTPVSFLAAVKRVRGVGMCGGTWQQVCSFSVPGSQFKPPQLLDRSTQNNVLAAYPKSPVAADLRSRKIYNKLRRARPVSPSFPDFQDSLCSL